MTRVGCIRKTGTRYEYKMTWISIKDELPIQKWIVQVKNGKSICSASYYRKKWYCRDRKLHKITHWAKDLVSYPKIPHKDMKKYLKRAEKYRHQMQTKNFKTGPIIGLYSGESLKPGSALDLIRELENGMDKY